MDDRTFDTIGEDDLEEIRLFANSELRRFVEEAGNPPGKYRSYRDRLLAVCLVQGAAQHFVDTRLDLPPDRVVSVDEAKISEKGYRVTGDGRVVSGIKDLDVVFFFKLDVAVAIPNRRHCKKSIERDFTKLGRRRLDFMKKGVLDNMFSSQDGDAVRSFVRCYLEQTNHGRNYLAKKSIIGLHPARVLGQPLWTVRRHRAR